MPRDLVGHATKGDREVLLVDLLEHHLDRAVVELDDVLEGEQQEADLFGQLAVGLGQLVEHVALGRPVGAVEDVGQGLDATGGRVLLRADGGQTRPHDGLDLGDDLRPGLGHQRDPQGHVGLDLRVDVRQHLGGQHRVQVRDDQRDRLRRLVAQEHDDLLGRRAAQELERATLDRGGQAADDLVRAVLAQRAHEHAAGVVDATLGEVVLGEDRLDGLGDDVAADLGRDLLGLGELERERLDLGVAEVLEDLARPLLADGDEQGGGLLDALQGLDARRGGVRLGQLGGSSD